MGIKAQSTNANEDAVIIGNIDLNKVIIHVYKTKNDNYPYKEFSIVTNEDTGEKEVVPNKIKGKVSKGGFIIINGVKSAEEIMRLVEGEKVYDEIFVRDVPNFNQYESLINDYIKESVFEDAENGVDIDSSLNVQEKDTSNIKEEADEEWQPFSGVVQYQVNEHEYKEEEEVEEEVEEVEADENSLEEKEEETEEQVTKSVSSPKQTTSKVSVKRQKSRKAPKYKARYNQKRSKKMSARSRGSKKRNTGCYKFRR